MILKCIFRQKSPKANNSSEINAVSMVSEGKVNMSLKKDESDLLEEFGGSENEKHSDIMINHKNIIDIRKESEVTAVQRIEQSEDDYENVCTARAISKFWENCRRKFGTLRDDQEVFLYFIGFLNQVRRFFFKYFYYLVQCLKYKTHSQNIFFLLLQEIKINYSSVLNSDKGEKN